MTKCVITMYDTKYSFILNPSALCTCIFVAHASVLYINFYAGKSKMLLIKKQPSAHIEQSCIKEIGMTCEMYLQCLDTVAQLSSDILIGLGCNEALVCKMWNFLKHSSGLQVQKFASSNSSLSPVLALFSQIFQYMLM